MSVIGQLFRGPNGNWDLGRFIGAKAAFVFPFPFLYAVVTKGVVPDPAAWGTGYAAVLLAIGGMIGIKDFGVAKANSLPPSPPTP